MAPPCLGTPLSSSPLHQSQKGWCQSVRGPGTSPQNSLPQFPQCRHRWEMGHTHALHACVQTPRGCCMCNMQCMCHGTACPCTLAGPHQPQQQQWHGRIVPTCRSMFHHAHTQVCPCACKPLFPEQLLPQSHSRVVPWQPLELVPPYWVSVYTDTHTCVCSDVASPTQQPWEKLPQDRGSHATVAG